MGKGMKIKTLNKTMTTIQTKICKENLLLISN